MALLSNPGFVAMLSGVEKTATGAGFFWIDEPQTFLQVKEGDTFSLTVDHNQSSVTSILWQEASNTEFTADLVDLAFFDATCDTNSNTTVGCDDSTLMAAGQNVTGTDIVPPVITGSKVPTGTTVVSNGGGTSFVISQAATDTHDPVTLAFSDFDVFNANTLTLTIGPVKVSRFPRPTATGGGARWDRNKYYRCKIVHSGTTYYSSTTEVMCDWPDPAGAKQSPNTVTTAHDP